MLRKFLAIFIFISLLFLLSCSNGTGSSSEFGKISGSVTFLGNWPSTGDVQVSAWTEWPPAGPPAVASDVFTSGVNPQDYVLEGLSKGTYKVITAGWRDPNNPSGALVLGVYWAKDSIGVDTTGMPTVNPQSIEVSSDHLNWNNINIVADLNIVQ